MLTTEIFIKIVQKGCKSCAKSLKKLCKKFAKVWTSYLLSSSLSYDMNVNGKKSVFTKPM